MFAFDEGQLRAAHHSWVGDCGAWEAQHKAEGSDGLSHLKILALLLHNLAKVPWVKPDTVAAYTSQERDLEFRGSAAQRDHMRQYIIDGEGVCLAFQFVIHCLNWYEYKRVDRLGKFDFRLTKALEHDLIVFLSSTECNQSAVYLILKAMYARHPAPSFDHTAIS